MEFKLTINDGSKSYKKIIKEPEANIFLGLKIGDKINGDNIGFNGYEFIINGGSSNTGTPMHKGVIGADRHKILKRLKNGSAIRKTVMGNTISEQISQINLVISKRGTKKIEEYFAEKEDAQ